jgi:hypothetical protein
MRPTIRRNHHHRTNHSPIHPSTHPSPPPNRHIIRSTPITASLYDAATGIAMSESWVRAFFFLFLSLSPCRLVAWCSFSLAVLGRPFRYLTLPYLTSWRLRPSSSSLSSAAGKGGGGIAFSFSYFPFFFFFWWPSSGLVCLYHTLFCVSFL